MDIVDKIEAYWSRLEKAKRLVVGRKVHGPSQDGERWQVEGSRQDSYDVNRRYGLCECVDYERMVLSGDLKYCKHLLAVEVQRKVDAGSVTLEELAKQVNEDVNSLDHPLQGQTEIPFSEGGEPC